jgi:hypothetical protein
MAAWDPHPPTMSRFLRASVPAHPEENSCANESHIASIPSSRSIVIRMIESS